MFFANNFFCLTFGMLACFTAFFNLINGNNCPKVGYFIHSTPPRNISCSQLLFSTTGNTALVIWDTAQTSVLTYDVTTQKVNGIQINTQTGSVTDGLFVGSSFTLVIALTDITLDCETTEGMTSQSGIGVGLIGLNLLTSTHSDTFSPGLTNTIKPTIVFQNITYTFTLPALVLC